MQMRPQVQIQSIIKSLSDVVLPALDPNNKLAQEQARLIVGLLGLMAKQLPLQFRYDCDELTRLLAFADELQRQAGVGDRELSAQQVHGARVLERAQADPDEVLQAVRDLRASTGALISRVFEGDDGAAQDRVQKTVLAMTSEQLLRERSWLLSQGWEPDPKAIPAIEQLLGISA